MNTSAERIGAVPGAPRITFLVDREGDSAAMLCTLVATKHDFIVRGNWDRTVRAADGRSNSRSSTECTRVPRAAAAFGGDGSLSITRNR